MMNTEQLISVMSYIKNEVSKRYAGKVIYVTVSGAHLYGFLSKDSDVDFRGCFTANPNLFLGLNMPKMNFDCVNPYDISMMELAKEIKLILAGNCNILEHVFSTPFYTTPEFVEMRDIAYSCLGKKGAYNSYRGMATSNYKKFILGGKQSFKKYLYVFRGLMAGRYFLETGMIEPDINKLNAVYKFPEIKMLIKAKTEGNENGYKEISNSGKLEELIQYCFQKIDVAYEKSKIPETPDKKATSRMNSFLVKLRKDMLDDE